MYVFSVTVVAAEGVSMDLSQGSGTVHEALAVPDSRKFVFAELPLEAKVSVIQQSSEAVDTGVEEIMRKSGEWKVAGALVLAFLLVPLVISAIHRQKLGMMKKCFSDDLEEEIEASLQAIGLLSNLAVEPHNVAADQARYMKRIQRLSLHTAGAAQHLSELNNSKLKLQSLRREIESTTERILSQTSYELEFFGESYLNKLSALSQMGLFLFYKEYLSNAVKHTSPAHIRVQFRSDAQKTSLKIMEEGMLGIANTELSPTLQHRARLINAKISSEVEEENNFAFVLVLPNNKWGMF